MVAVVQPGWLQCTDGPLKNCVPSTATRNRTASSGGVNVATPLALVLVLPPVSPAAFTHTTGLAVDRRPARVGDGHGHRPGDGDAGRRAAGNDAVAGCAARVFGAAELDDEPVRPLRREHRGHAARVGVVQPPSSSLVFRQYTVTFRFGRAGGVANRDRHRDRRR